jgi:hypothetical protein
MLAYVDGGPELLARDEYLATENRILKEQLKGRLMLSDAERATLGEIGHRLGRKKVSPSWQPSGAHDVGLPEGMLAAAHDYSASVSAAARQYSIMSSSRARMVWASAFRTARTRMGLGCSSFALGQNLRTHITRIGGDTHNALRCPPPTAASWCR